MKKRPRARAAAAATVNQLLELEARLGVVEGFIAQTGGFSSSLSDLRRDLTAELERVRNVALEAHAWSSDALETRQLARSHEDRLTNLTLAVAEGIAHVERAEARIRATVQRARSQLAEAGIESPALEAESDQLQLLDEGGSGGRRLHAVRDDMGADAPPPEPDVRADDNRPSAIPGMTRGALRRFRGA